MGEAAENVYVPEPGKVAIRDLDGSVSLVKQADLPAAQTEGARPATESEYFGAKHGTAGDVAAGVVGAARGATFGLFDPAFVEATRAVAGDQQAEEYRNTLRLLKEASPNATLGGEIAGAVAPAFFGAPAASGAALGEGALARFGARALSAAPRAVAEGAAIGAGQQLSEDTLGNHKLVGEAYLNAGIKGGALGLLLGAGGAGALGAAGDAVGGARDKLASLFGRGAAREEEAATVRAVESPYRGVAAEGEAAAEAAGPKSLIERAQDLRDQFTYKSTGANRTDVARLGKTAEEQGERMQSIADRLRSETYEGKPIVEALAGEKEINRRIVGRANEVGKELSGLRKELDAATVKPSTSAIANRFEQEVATPAARLPGGESEIRGANRFVRDLIKKGGDEPSFEYLYQSRRKLDAMRYDIGIPKAERKAYDALRGIVEDEYVSAGERAAKEIGGTFADNYRLKKSLYSDLATAREASNRAVGRGTGNNAVSLTDYAAAGIGAVAGGPAGLVAAGLNMVKRHYGNQIAAHVLDAATRMEGVQRAAAKLDVLMSDGAKAFITGSKSGIRAAKPVTTAEVRALREATRTPEAVNARIAEELGDLPKYAPKVAQQVAATAARVAAWAQHALPKEEPPMTPQFGQPRDIPLSHAKLLQARAVMETMADGSIVIDRMRDGSLTDAHVATLKFTQPETYSEIQRYLTQHATELAKTMTQQQLTRLGLLFGEPLTEQDLPENRRAFQASFSQGNQAPGKGGAGGNTGPAAAIPSGGGNTATAYDRLEVGK